jgi:hypothetical protein
VRRCGRLVIPVSVEMKSAMIANDRSLFARFFSTPLQLMVAVAFLVGVMVVGLVI